MINTLEKIYTPILPHRCDGYNGETCQFTVTLNITATKSLTFVYTDLRTYGEHRSFIMDDRSYDQLSCIESDFIIQPIVWCYKSGGYVRSTKQDTFKFIPRKEIVERVRANLEKINVKLENVTSVSVCSDTSTVKQKDGTSISLSDTNVISGTGFHDRPFFWIKDDVKHSLELISVSHS